MKRTTVASFALLLALLVGPAAPSTTEPSGSAGKAEGAPTATPTAENTDSRGDDKTTGAPRVRKFDFHYRFAIHGLTHGKTCRVWLPVAVSNRYQEVEPLAGQLPAEPSFHTEPKYGNRVLYFEVEVPENGELAVNLPYRVRRKELASKLHSARLSINDRAGSLKPDQRALFLRANARVPIEGKPLELLGGIDLSKKPLRLARQLYQVVDDHVTYKKEGTGWGRGDVLWVCDTQYGNCTDFHSLFISLARSQGLPARFEIGFSIPTDADAGSVGGYHCWAFFYLDQYGWLPVDVSEADKHPELKEYYFGNLTPDRVTFSIGRDINLAPQQAGPPLNFFIYPYVEVAGKPLPKTQIKLDFSYADRPQNGKPASDRD